MKIIIFVIVAKKTHFVSKLEKGEEKKTSLKEKIIENNAKQHQFKPIFVKNSQKRANFGCCTGVKVTPFLFKCLKMNYLTKMTQNVEI